MKKENFNLIICPNCKKDALNPQNLTEDAVEIISGKIRCGGCGKIYSIEEGIADLILVTDEVKKESDFYLRETDAMIKNDPDFMENTEDFVLALPEINEKHTNRPKIINYFVNQGRNFYFLLEKLNLKPGSRVLDIGAGKCWTTAEFARRDYKAFALEIIKEKYVGLKTAEIYMKNQNIFFERICADMTNLPFKNKMFDLVSFNSSIHHAPEIEKAVSEAVRVLKDDGAVMLVNEPVKAVFRPHKHHDDLKEAGLNENTYFIWEYKKVFEKYGVKFKTYFPASFDFKLKKWAKEGNILQKAAGNIYTRVFSRLINLRIIRTPLHSLFGMGLNMIGKNKR